MLTHLKINAAEAVTTTHGAQLASYKINGREYIWHGNPEIWGDHTPVLFPIIGGLKDGITTIDGRQYSIRKHGFARYSIFDTVRTTDTAAEYQLSTSAETAESYPFDFSLRVKHKIRSNGFDTSYTVTNRDTKPMPYCIGGHPGIMLGDYTEWTIEFEKDENTDLYNVSKEGIFSESLKAGRLNGRSLPLGYPRLFDNGALIARDINSRKVTLLKNDNTERITVDFTDFDLLAVWTPPGKNAPFVCIEPWCGMSPGEDETGRFEDKPFVKTLRPGTSRTFTYSITIE